MTSITKMNENGNNGQLATAGGFEGFQILDPRSETGVSAQTAPRANYIATISAGKRNEKGLPDRTKDGEIYIHGDAPALEAALKANGMKSLTVAFPSNDPREFIQQRFAQYSASALLAYGDGNSVTEIQDGQRFTYESGTPDYRRVIENCKVSVSVYFMLAEWTDRGADMTFNDGFGLYRLRFTSRNSLQSILFSMQHMAQMTGGQIAGIPFDLFLRKEEHADGAGKKRPCWIWQCIPRPPKGIRLDATTFKAFAQHGVEQVGMLQLKAPEPETIDVALADVAEGTVIDLEEEEEISLNPGNNDFPAETPEPQPQNPQPVMCDARDYQKRYFAIAGKSTFSSDAGRHEFVRWFTQGKTDSLQSFLANATEAQAQALCDALEEMMRTREAEEKAAAQRADLIDGPRMTKISDQAKVLWGDDWKARLEAETGGWKAFKTMSRADADALITRFEQEIQEMESMNPDAGVETEAGQQTSAAPPNVDADGVIEGDAEEEGEASSVPPLDDPLSKAVRAKREAAANLAPPDALFDDFDETDPFADDEPASEYAKGAI